MKKTIFSALLVFSIVTSCNQVEESKAINSFSKEIAIMTKINSDGLKLASSDLVTNILSISKSEINFDRKKLMTSILTSLTGKYFQASDATIKLVASKYEDLKISEFISERKNSLDVSNFKLYNGDQLNLAQPFINQLLSTQDLEAAKSLALKFQDDVVATTLTRDDKLELLALSASINGLSDFIESGGIDNIKSLLSNSLSTGTANGRAQGCSVDWRGVWAGAVVGFFGGGASGAYVGCQEELSHYQA